METDEGFVMVAACVAKNIQFGNRFEWSQRFLTTSGDCLHGTLKWTLILRQSIKISDRNYNNDDNYNNDNNNDNNDYYDDTTYN